VRCPVCLGEGVELKRPRKPILGKHVIQDNPAEDEAFTNYLIRRWGLKGFEVEGLEKF